MSYQFYKILHVFAVLVLLTSLGSLVVSGASTSGALRRLASIGHGVALALVLVAGFGLLARLGMFGAIPLWAWLKIGIWLVLGAAVLPLRRRPEWATFMWVLLPVLGGVAAWLAIQKPF